MAMLTAESPVVADSFRVEVSGWDENQIFFVEKSHLDWGNFDDKHISLRHMLPDGAMVFLRVLQPTASQQPPPSAYQVEFIGCHQNGHHQFRLRPVHPRYNNKPACVH
jgi:hypothetical protein